jgi:SAM-dependent methyltransferase
METSKRTTQSLAETYAKRGDPNGWFEAFYAQAKGDIHNVYWADLKASPVLLDYLEEHKVQTGAQAITIGCGLGDDAEALSQHGFHVTAFDISPSAINMCRQRYPGSAVDYMVADLFNHPPEWSQGFDLIYECNTIQILKGPDRVRAVNAMANLLAPNGEILVSCRSRKAEEQSNAFPLALDREEIDGFQRAGLTEKRFISYEDDQDPPVPHFFAVYKRPA